MFSSQCTHLLSRGAQLCDASLNWFPEAEHSLELFLQEVALIGRDTHYVPLSLSPEMV